MPTKPAASFSLATATNYTSGPQIGNPTKVVPADLANGLIPGEGIPAAWFNYMLAIAGDWSAWSLAGSSSASLTAHVVEADSLGATAVASATFGGTASGATALVVAVNTGSVGAAASFTNTSTGFALVATASGASAAVRGVGGGTGPGVEGLGLGTNNTGVKGNGQGTASGGTFVGGATGHGSTCTGGATGGYGSLCTGTGANAGLAAIGGPTASQAILGAASAVAQNGVHGQALAGGLSTAAGVFGQGIGDAAGVRSTATNGYGVVCATDTSSPTRAPLRVTPTDADPTTALAGDVGHRSDLDAPRVYRDSLWTTPWTTPGGNAHALAAPRTTNATNASAVTYVALVSATLAAPYAPKLAGGQVLLHASSRFGDADSSAHHHFIDVEILDATAGVSVYSARICTGPAVVDATVDGFAISQWSISVPYTIPLAGGRVFTLRFKCATASGFNAVANDSSLNVLGVFG